MNIQSLTSCQHASSSATHQPESELKASSSINDFIIMGLGVFKHCGTKSCTKQGLKKNCYSLLGTGNVIGKNDEIVVLTIRHLFFESVSPNLDVGEMLVKTPLMSQEPPQYVVYKNRQIFGHFNCKLTPEEQKVDGPIIIPIAKREGDQLKYYCQSENIENDHIHHPLETATIEDETGLVKTEFMLEIAQQYDLAAYKVYVNNKIVLPSNPNGINPPLVEGDHVDALVVLTGTKLSFTQLNGFIKITSIINDEMTIVHHVDIRNHDKLVYYATICNDH